MPNVEQNLKLALAMENTAMGVNIDLDIVAKQIQAEFDCASAYGDSEVANKATKHRIQNAKRKEETKTLQQAAETILRSIRPTLS